MFNKYSQNLLLQKKNIKINPSTPTNIFKDQKNERGTSRIIVCLDVFIFKPLRFEFCYYF